MAETNILIVEDNDRLRLLLHHWLSITLPDSHVTEAQSGEEVLVLAQTFAQPPDGILMDIGLSQMKESSLLGASKRSGRRSTW